MLLRSLAVVGFGIWLIMSMDPIRSMMQASTAPEKTALTWTLALK
jgi:hypothetical protein